MTIPDEAVEAAALALLERDYGVRDWGITGEQVKAAYMDEARAALEAAAPHLLAIGWDACADLPSRPDKANNPYRSQA